MIKNNDAIQKLIKGHQHFYDYRFSKAPEVYQSLVREGQSPKVMVIACSDSRTDPSILFNATPGDLFQLRNVANLVPTYAYQDHACSVSAALVFAVDVLKVEHIIVLGHTYCGGIETLMKAEEDIHTDHQGIRDWADIAAQAKAQTLLEHPDASFKSLCHHCERESIKQSLKNLMTHPFIASGVEANALMLHGWLFDRESGNIDAYDSSHNQFLSLS